MALNTSRCSHPMPLRFKGLNRQSFAACLNIIYI